MIRIDITRIDILIVIIDTILVLLKIRIRAILTMIGPDLSEEPMHGLSRTDSRAQGTRCGLWTVAAFHPAYFVAALFDRNTLL